MLLLRANVCIVQFAKQTERATDELPSQKMYPTAVARCTWRYLILALRHTKYAKHVQSLLQEKVQKQPECSPKGSREETYTRCSG